MTRLLWHSNAPHASTGYGQQTALMLPRLKEHYDHLACSAFYGSEGNIIMWNGIPVLPGIGVTHGNEAIIDHARWWFEGNLRDGLVLTLMDVWVLSPDLWSQLNVASWVPVDHEPAPRPVCDFFHVSGAVPIAMSRFGEELLRESGLDPLYVPHGVDTSVYKPVPKAEARKETHMPADAYIVGMVAANKGNPSRKCFVEAMLAFKEFQRHEPDARLYLHTEILGRFDGINIPTLINDIGLDPDLVLFADQYRVLHYPFSHETMAKVYSSLDVLLMPSAGEGFGIPAVEAQACGVPVIGSNFSAQKEVIGAGVLVDGHRVYTPIKAWQFHPSVEEITEALRAVCRGPDVSAKAREHAEGYNIDKVFAEHMLPALEQIEARFEDRKPV